MKGETKADVLEGDVECPDFVPFSLYDTKPFHFLPMVDEKLAWNINKKYTYEKETKKKVKLQFYNTELQIYTTIKRIQLMLTTRFVIEKSFSTG